MASGDPPKPKSESKVAQPSAPSILDALKNTPPISEISEGRVDVIVSVASIEALLSDALLSILAPSMDDKEDDLFDDSRPLGSFMLKAKLGMRMGVISPTLFKALRVLSDIRNKCAHEDDKTFDVFADASTTGKIDYLYGQLSTDYAKKVDKPSEKFAAICGLISAYFVVFKPTDGKTVFHDNELIFKKTQ